VARNRKRAKERRARRPESVAAARSQREQSAPSPLSHATPDVELAEAQLEVGRPDAVDQSEERPDSLSDAEPSSGRADEADGRRELLDEADERRELLDEADGELDEDEFDELDSGGVPTAPGADRSGGGFTGGPPSDGGGELSVPGGAVPQRRQRAGPRLIHFLQGSWRELQRVQWPDRRQVMQATGVVIGFVIIAGLYLGLADYVAGKVVTYILK
jgi:preprotein translocase subunit SecE